MPRHSRGFSLVLAMLFEKSDKVTKSRSIVGITSVLVRICFLFLRRGENPIGKIHKIW